MPSDSLREVRLRIDRANKNINDLKRFMPGRSPEVPGDLFEVKRQPDGKTYVVVLKVYDPSPDLRMAIGDVMHGLRTSLDHLSYRLAILNKFPVSGGTPEQRKKLRKLCFLIHEDALRFNNAAGNLRPLIGDRAVTAMEKLQTYKGFDPRGPGLWRLSELDNIAKHRMIPAVQKVLEGAVVNIVAGDKRVSGTLVKPKRREALKDGAKLFSFVLKAEKEPPKVDVNVKSAMAIVFADTEGLCDGDNVFQVMRDSVKVVGTVVDDFERDFF